MTKPQAHQMLTIRNQNAKEPGQYTKQASHERRETLNEQIDAFFKSGGAITKLPDYDANYDGDSPRACGFGGSIEVLG